MGGWRPTLVLLASLLAGCGPARLIGYVLVPDAPTFVDGDEIVVPGLRAPVEIAQREDGIFRIRAADERDAAVAQGYLMARDRMAQLDLFRHIARGELAALLGDRPFGERTSLETDVLNRFLGFRERADALLAATPPVERSVLDAFVAGINAWIDEQHLALEHRLLGVSTVRPWTPQDSLAIYAMLMHGLSGNADREVRRLVLACRSGIDAMERVWPTDLEAQAFALPPQDLRAETLAPAPAVVPEMRERLAELCPDDAGERVAAAPAGLGDLLVDGWSASNNWVVAGERTASGKPILSSDPHLPHMNPPLVWGIEIQTPEHHVAGFTLPGLGRIVFGHNGRVAWGATTNHVDRQDLVVHVPRREQRDGAWVEGYEVDGRFVPFEVRRETFVVKDGDTVERSARFTADGPLLNDIDTLVRGRIPLTALRRTPLLQGMDLDGAARMNRSGNLDELTRGLSALDLGCSSWVLADAAGAIAYRSPCVVPVRDGFSGSFPLPGWLSRYDWRGFYAKEDLPASTRPARGWLATANNQIVPSSRFPSTYNADVSAPNRFRRIASRLEAAMAAGDGLQAEASAGIQLDVAFEPWEGVRSGLLAELCADRRREPAAARELLCSWDGNMAADSAAATVFVHFTNALLDRALADDLPAGVDDRDWHFVQSLPQFEVRAQSLLADPTAAAVWDDAQTEVVEDRAAIVEAAFVAAVAEAGARYGSDVDGWAWGRVRPLVLRHAFAPNDGALGWVLNAEPLAIGGGPETVYKNQFARSDRERMNPVVGPIVRFTVDLADPWKATYSLAGGQSGWPRSPHYGDLLADWAVGRGRALTPEPSPGDRSGRLLPAG